MRPIACIGQNPPTVVAELIDPVSVSWRADILSQFFLLVDVTTIQNNPLCTRSMADFWSWQFETRGVFSVRSAYRMLWETKRRGEDLLSGRASSSNHTLDEKGWPSLWQTKVPSKIRSFLWRLARQSLPTEDVRQHRNMSMVDNCQLCVTLTRGDTL